MEELETLKNIFKIENVFKVDYYHNLRLEQSVLNKNAQNITEKIESHFNSLDLVAYKLQSPRTRQKTKVLFRSCTRWYSLL